MSDISIIIPHRGNSLGLWATVTSCENELINSGISAEYIFITNGEDTLNIDTKNVIARVDTAGRLKYHKHYVEGISPPEARQLGAYEASSKYLFFFDNHCLVGKDYFKRSLYDFEKYDIDLLHSTTQYYVDDTKCYQYKFKLAYNFWGNAMATPMEGAKPYRIGAGGHGGFSVKKDVWEETGGYGPKGLFQGYGGEEFYTDLKFWRLGKSVWIDPLVLHYHYAGDRGYKRHYYDDYFINMMSSAYVIGGQKWLDIVFQSFCDESKHTRFSTGPELTPMFDLYVKATERVEDHVKELDSKSTRSLDELLVWFREQNIAF